jgi:hypothetical protein
MAAGLGFKTFATGDVLTAGDTNGYLMQGVWVFADAAARTAAVTSPQEGNISYLKDTNSTEYYSGSAWVAIAGGAVTIQTATFNDTKSSGTAGGTFTSGAWRTRDLNTTQFNGITSASLSSNQISLPAGTYYVIASAPAFYVNEHQVRFQNITDSTTAILGQNSGSGQILVAQPSSTLSGSFTIAGTKTFELQHRCATTKADNGFGAGPNWGSEVYGQVSITKVA